MASSLAPINSTPTPDDQNLYWSKEYVMASSEFLQNKFGLIYASLLVNKLFREQDQALSRKALLKSTVGGSVKKPKCDWIFDTTAIRGSFRKLFDQDMEVDTNC